MKLVKKLFGLMRTMKDKFFRILLFSFIASLYITIGMLLYLAYTQDEITYCLKAFPFIIIVNLLVTEILKNK